MANSSFFSCHKLAKMYEDKLILNDISFQLNKGEIICFLGPSGCGKSTLLRCIAGLESLSSGSIFVDGDRIDEAAPQKNPVVMMFQQALLFPHLTVLENTIYGLKSTKLKKQEKLSRGMEILKKMELQMLANDYPYQLSGGQQQRVALARALLVEPKLLLLDEPFSSIDAQLKITLRNWVKNKLKEWNTTAIFVTHDKEEAMILADRIAVINEGVIQQIGTPSELYEEPKTLFVAKFVSEGIVDGKLFIPLTKVQIHENETDVKEKYDYCYEAEVGAIFYKGGQKFYQLEIMKLKQEISCSSSVDLILGQIVYLGVNEKDIVFFEGKHNLH